MSYSTAKGAVGEREAAEFFDSLVKPDFHLCRIGGIEARKMVLAGDVAILLSCKKHRFRGRLDVKNCPFYDYFIEVKCQASPNIWKDMEKAEDDANLAGKIGAIGYFIKQSTKKGQRGGDWRNFQGKRLIVMTPEIFRKLLKN